MYQPHSCPTVTPKQAYVVKKFVSKDDLENEFPSELEAPDDILLQRKKMLHEYIGCLDHYKMLPWQENYRDPILTLQIGLENVAACHRNTQPFKLNSHENSPEKIILPPSPPPEDATNEPAKEEEVMTSYVENMKENNSYLYYQMAAKALAIKVIRLQSIIQAYGIEIPADLKIGALISSAPYQTKPVFNNITKSATGEVKTSNISNINLNGPRNLLQKHNKQPPLVSNAKKPLNQKEVNICSIAPSISQKEGRIGHYNAQKQQLVKFFPQTKTNNVSDKSSLLEVSELQRRCKNLLKKRRRDESVLYQVEENRRISKVPRRSQFQYSIPRDTEDLDDDPRDLEIVNDFIQLLAAISKDSSEKRRVKSSPRKVKKHNKTSVRTCCKEHSPVLPPNENKGANCVTKEFENNM